MSVIKILAIFVSCLAATNCLATSNVCCPWTKSCSCPKGLVVFKSPWICVNNKLWLLRKADKVYGQRESDSTQIMVCKSNDNYTVPFLACVLFFIGGFVLFYGVKLLIGFLSQKQQNHLNQLNPRSEQNQQELQTQRDLQAENDPPPSYASILAGTVTEIHPTFI